MSFSSSLFKHGAHALATATVGVLRDVTSETSQRIAQALDLKASPQSARHDVMARAAERMSSNEFSYEPAADRHPHEDAGGVALVAGGLIGIVVAVLLASRH